MALSLWSAISHLLMGLFLVFPAQAQGPPGANEYFKITVVDEETGRGVPLVELRTTNEIRYYTDSNGIVAFHELALMGQKVFFHVQSHGYEFPKDGFGYRGKALEVKPGGSAVLKIKRVNVAERLYRLTGEGIYRDSILVGHPVPIRSPLLNGQVMGQDSGLAVPYRGKIFWIWGDTSRPSYPLGNFGASGATSELPGRGGLDPSVGIDLTYFVNESGFSKEMCPSSAIPGPGPRWLGGMTTIQDEKGRERLIAGYARIKDLGTAHERGLVIFNDKTESFERLARLDVNEPLRPEGHSFRAQVNGRDYLYFSFSPPHAMRVRADMKHVTDPRSHEGFTCLAAGSRYDKSSSKLDRGPDGRLRYAWKTDTPPIGFDEQKELIKAGKMSRGEAWPQLEDIETGSPIKAHAGTVYWNAFRKRWVMIAEQSGGTSLLGEIWYAEADTVTGPWVYARKIVTHNKYSFYNPAQRPFFDQQGGRIIYFDGTYSEFFSGAREKTPCYDYNQIMYRLALDDPRLFLPAPVYRVESAGGSAQWLLREGVESQDAWPRVQEAAFFANPPDRQREGLIPIYSVEGKSGIELRAETPAERGEPCPPLFYALPAEEADSDSASPSVAPLYEYSRTDNGARFYSTNPDLNDDSLKRSQDPICRVWRDPMSLLILDYETKPIIPAEK